MLGFFAGISDPTRHGIKYQRGTIAVPGDVDYTTLAADSRSASGGAVMRGSVCLCRISRKKIRVTFSTFRADCLTLCNTVI